MKLRERDEPLDPEVERDLDAVDRALAGRPVDPDLAGWEELATLLTDERPDLDAEWAEELDRRETARLRGGDEGDPLRRLAARVGGMRPGRLLAPAGALATLVVVAVVAISMLEQGGGDVTSEAPTTLEATDAGSGGSGDALSGDALRQSGDPAAAAGESAADPGEAFRAELYGLSERASPVLPDGRTTFKSFQLGDLNAAKIAPGTEKRQIERDVTLSLSTRPEEVRETSDEVISITRSLGGIVASSQVSEAGRQSSATLQLTVPTRNLDSAIDQLTELANVESLNEATIDITKPYVSAQDRLQDAEAERRGLIEALGNAETDAEAEALRLQIDDARREISRAESAFENIARRARLSDLSVTVVGDPDAKDDRSIGDWLDDAGTVLRDVAGVLLITAAVVVPLAILVALIWFAASRIRRMRRERALG